MRCSDLQPGDLLITLTTKPEPVRRLILTVRTTTLRVDSPAYTAVTIEYLNSNDGQPARFTAMDRQLDFRGGVQVLREGETIWEASPCSARER